MRVFLKGLEEQAAGDTICSAADFRVPMAAVTFLYRKGYYKRNGKQVLPGIDNGRAPGRPRPTSPRRSWRRITGG